MLDAPMSVATVQRWCVAITLPRVERIAKRQFEDAGVAAFLPLRERPPTPERPLIVEPKWPGYLFVCTRSIPTRPEGMPGAGESLVRAARGIISTQDGCAILTPPGLVEGLMEQADPDGLIDRYEAPEVYRPQVGHIVRIAYGKCCGQFGEVKETRGARLKVEMSCASSQMSVEVKVEQVEFAG
jgi:transcription antitermination factor NusG